MSKSSPDTPDAGWAGLIAGLDTASDATLQQVLDAAVRAYTARAEERAIAPFPPGTAVTATDVVIFATEILKAVELQPFELSMWQAWSAKD